MSSWPSPNPEDFLNPDTGYAIGDFYQAWVTAMEERHETFTTDFVKDTRYPARVRAALTIVPFAGAALEKRFHLLDQNEHAVHNDRSFRASRRLAILFAKFREADPFACDVWLDTFGNNDVRIGRHAILDRTYGTIDGLVPPFGSRIYGFMDMVVRTMDDAEDIASYAVSDGFVWPSFPSSVGRPRIGLSDLREGSVAFKAASAMAASGAPPRDVAAALSVMRSDPARAAEHVDVLDGSGSVIERRDAAAAISNSVDDGFRRTPYGFLGFDRRNDPRRHLVVAPERVAALMRRIDEFDLAARFGIFEVKAPGGMAELNSALRFGPKVLILKASHESWSDQKTYARISLPGISMVIVDDEPERMRLIEDQASVLGSMQKGGPELFDLRNEVFDSSSDRF